jgi:hypothetical protein
VIVPNVKALMIMGCKWKYDKRFFCHKLALTHVPCVLFQAYAAEAGPEAAQQPIEEAGMSEEVIQKVSMNKTCLALIKHFVAFLQFSWSFVISIRPARSLFLLPCVSGHLAVALLTPSSPIPC